MKALKTTVVLLLAVALLGLCACGGKQPGAEATPEPTAAPLTETDVQGVLEGQVYTNAFIGIGCELDAGWTYLDSDQLYELSGAVADALPEDLSQVMESGGVLYAMYAMADGGLRTVGIALEKLNVINSIVLDEAGYIDAAIEQTAAAMESAGMTIHTCEHATVDFAGAERECIHVEGEVSGVALYENIIPIKCGSYMAVCTIACYQTDTLADTGAAFHALQ